MMDARPNMTRRARRSVQEPRFITGSLLRHILVMTSAGAIGLMTVFIGDLANIYFLSLLADQIIVAAVSYASSIVSLTIYIGVGLAIATTAAVSPVLGAGYRIRARRLSVNALIWAFVVSVFLAVILWIAVPSLMTLLGARGRTHDLACDYLRIMVFGLPPIAVAIASSAVLRSSGDARRAMYMTIFGAVVNIVLDPILIFGAGLGIHGAAIASTVARFMMCILGLYYLIKVHDLLGRPKYILWLKDAPLLAAVAIPAIVTNAATPTANAYITSAISEFGDGAVAGWGIIGRIMPVAFGAIYALTGSVGPIIGQNFGIRNHQRMRQTLTLSLMVSAGFTLVAWLGLVVLANPITTAFHAKGEAAELIQLFCRWLSPLFVFLGALFVCNAVFNTLGRPHVSTMLNWTRATLGTIPFVLVGAHYGGAPGVLLGMMLGGIVVGLLAIVLAYRMLAQLETEG
ncbi:MAG: MATE family efflux transporter [Hyphomicrobiaceae bacterium]